ncbi:hypothetical protein [Gymnodinialimonas ulvae]|uniref:hypothetical protein n=1 Tax=Gymnodinialimonas ulvae TaxID=3126504 RepID=UPI0030B5EFF0
MFLVARAVLRGPEYIAACNQAFDRRFLDRARFSIWEICCVRATPFALHILGAWAGFEVFSGLFWFLEDNGRIDEFGEWASYRQIFATTLGIPSGLFFFYSVTRTCEKVWIRTLQAADVAPVDWLEYELGGRNTPKPEREKTSD